MQVQAKQIPHNDLLPTEIGEAKGRNELAVFVGAGFPRNFGCWDWNQLAKGFIKKCEEVGIFNARERCNYIDLLDNKQQTTTDMITFCFKKLVENDSEREIKILLEEACMINAAVNGKATEAYSELKRLGDYYITTNYDSHFDKLFPPERILYKRSLFCNLNGNETLEKNTLYHIHGSIEEIDSLVLTNDHYLERYTNRNYKEFLRKTFSNYTVLFIGCSIEDYIRDILRENKRMGNANHNFLLKKYFTDQQDSYTLETAIYSDFDVKVLSYLGDEKEYLELLNIIKSWNNQIGDMGLEVQ